MNKTIIGYLYFSRKSEKFLKTVKTTKKQRADEKYYISSRQCRENEEEGKINER